MMTVPGVRQRLGRSATKGLICALAIFATACNSIGRETPYPSAEAEPAASTGAQVSPETGATWRAAKPSGGTSVQEAPTRMGLSEPEFYRGTGELMRFQPEGQAEAPVSETGKVTPRRISGTCPKHQRKLALQIKRARQIALLPYAAKHV